jgi:hypothetical protein
MLKHSILLQLCNRIPTVLAALAAALIPLISPAQANESDSPLLFSGFAFSGDYSNKQTLYPYSAALAQENNGTYLDTIFRQKLQKHPAALARVTLEQSDGSKDQTSLAFALVHEGVEFQKIDGQIWTFVTLQANILAFNRSSGSVVASYPLRLLSTDVSAGRPTEDTIRAMVRNAFASDDPGKNIFDLWLNRFEKIKIKSGARKYVRVTNISIAPEAGQVILAAQKDEVAIKNQIANFLETAISEKTGVPVVPNSAGEAIGNKMMLRFADSSSLQLNLPEADFAVKFSLRNFVSKKIEQETAFQDIYRVKAGISITMPEINRTYLDENIYDTMIFTHPKNAGVEVTDWDQYFKLLQSLILSLGTQLVTADEAWLKEHASRALEAKPGFLNSKQLLQGLR